MTLFAKFEFLQLTNSVHCVKIVYVMKANRSCDCVCQFTWFIFVKSSSLIVRCKCDIFHHMLKCYLALICMPISRFRFIKSSTFIVRFKCNLALDMTSLTHTFIEHLICFIQNKHLDVTCSKITSTNHIYTSKHNLNGATIFQCISTFL